MLFESHQNSVSPAAKRSITSPRMLQRNTLLSQAQVNSSTSETPMEVEAQRFAAVGDFAVSDKVHLGQFQGIGPRLVVQHPTVSNTGVHGGATGHEVRR